MQPSFPPDWVIRWQQVLGRSVLLDVRSPGEFAAGHLPGAVSLPLLSDAQRAEVGTAYKLHGAREALRLALLHTGPRLAEIVTAVAQYAEAPSIGVYCWRGGMRSESVAWLLQLAGYPAHQLAGGYKDFRRVSRWSFAFPWDLRVLGGCTGVGKTERLHAMAAEGHQVVDLEGLACHAGSVFGHLLSAQQPTQAQFEVELAAHLLSMDPTRPIWVEAESRAIGRLEIPPAFYSQMLHAPLYLLEASLAERMDRLVHMYGRASSSGLMDAVRKIQRRLGAERTQAALKAIEEGSLHHAAEVLLDYYDRTYLYSCQQRPGKLAGVFSMG